MSDHTLLRGLGTLGMALLLMSGCANSTRTKISLPPLADSPSPQTIFGEATLTPDGDPEAPLQIPLTPDRPLTLAECIETAKKVSPSLDSADQSVAGSMWNRWGAITSFLPTASTTYSATRYNDMTATGRSGSWAAGRTRYSWQGQLNQPLFTGGRNSSNYLLAQLGVAAADIQKTQATEDLLLLVKEAYYSILAFEKALTVAKSSVVTLTSHLNVAQNYFDVGMKPKNEVLDAEVELAQAIQDQTDINRDLIVAKTRLNIILRQAVDKPLAVVDILQYLPFPLSLEQCLNTGLANNAEIQLGRNQVKASAKGVDLARSGYYPQVGLALTNDSVGNKANAHGGWSTDDASWNVAMMATFNFWEWGKTKSEVEVSKVELNRSLNSLLSLEDDTKLQVTTNYQNLVSAGKNIGVSSKAVVSAAENLRMVTERYLEQVATNTDVLDAQTSYSEAQYNHYQALYDYHLAWAQLERTLGREVLPTGMVEADSAGDRS